MNNEPLNHFYCTSPSPIPPLPTTKHLPLLFKNTLAPFGKKKKKKIPTLPVQGYPKVLGIWGPFITGIIPEVLDRGSTEHWRHVVNMDAFTLDQRHALQWCGQVGCQHQIIELLRPGCTQCPAHIMATHGGRQVHAQLSGEDSSAPLSRSAPSQNALPCCWGNNF